MHLSLGNFPYQALARATKVVSMRSRRRSKVITGLAAAAMVVSAVVLASPAAAAELATNGGFESGTLAGWSCTGGTGSVVTSPVRTGTRRPRRARPGERQRPLHPDRHRSRANSAYTLTAWVRGNYVYLASRRGEHLDAVGHQLDAAHRHRQLRLGHEPADLPARLVRARAPTTPMTSRSTGRAAPSQPPATPTGSPSPA